MNDDLVKRLREVPIDGTATLDQHDYWLRAGELTHEAANRIEQLEVALRKLDDMVCELDAGNLQLFEVGDFIDAALAGEKKDDYV